MTDSEAKAMIEAYMECDRRKNDVAYEKQCHKDCDNCKLCYAQGTVGEHREAMNMAIKALEKQIPKKIVKHDKCPVCNNGQSTTWYYVGASYCEYCGQKLSWESDTD